MSNKSIIPVVLLALGLGACEKVSEYDAPTKGQISFGASTGYENYGKTRTEYSGVDENENVISSTSQHERIEWVADYDRIRILCGQTRDVDDLANPSGTFKISAKSDDGEKSYADVDQVGGTPFFWGTGMHYFYALYPAEGTTSNYYEGTVSESDASIALDGNKAGITGAIPAAQGSVKSGNVYKPNMNYAFMYAAAKTERTDDNNVVLQFKPLVTTFEFQLKALDDEMATADLATLKLTSTSTRLTGSFTATLDLDATQVATVTPGTGAGSEITVTFPAGTRLTKTDYITATVLALGVEQSNLTLTLTFGNGVSRSLKLNKSVSGVSTPISVAACKKAYFKLDVNGHFDYFLGSLSPITVSYWGGTANLASGFKSYKTDGHNSQPVPFVLEYSPSGADGTWSTTCDWITANGVDYNGSVTGETFTATLNAQANSGSDPQRDALRAKTAKDNFDLSTKNVATGGIVSRSTANCYVVDAPGTYRFPLVYGNAVQNGSVNDKAFRGTDGGSSYWSDGGQAYTDAVMGTVGFFLGRFKDHANQNITTAYIASKYPSNLNAILLWQDSPGLVKVDYNITGTGENAYLTFTVDKETIAEGNALVAVRSGTTILWSWHIWVTATDLAAGASGPSGKVFAPVNLGWCEGKSIIYAQRQYYVRARQPESGLTSAPVLMKENPFSDVYKGNNVYYQWGRKDPMQSGDGQNVGSDGTQQFKPYYSETGYAPNHSGSSYAGNLGVGIQNPHIEYNTNHSFVGSNYVDWVNISFNDFPAINSWDSGLQYLTFVFRMTGSYSYGMDTAKNAAAVNHNVIKTIYDPSPVGYKVPNVGAFSGLTTSNFGWTTVNGQKGRKYGSLFLPAVGGYSQAIHGVNLGGAYLTANAEYPDGSVDVLTFQESGSEALMYTKAGDGNSFAYTQRFACWCVRPIKE